MAESHVISGLKAKQEEIRRRIAELEQQLQVCRKDEATISEVLRIFGDVEAYARPKKLFSRGDVSRAIFDALRAAPDGLTVRMLSEAVMRQNGLDANNEDVAVVARKRVENALYRYLGQGRLSKCGMHNGAYVWRTTVTAGT